jgi:anti-sigma B factor antagonist
MSVGADFIVEETMEPSFDIETVRRGDEIVFVVEGEIDIATAPLLEERLSSPDVASARTVIVDLDRVTFMDSTGLRVLVSHALSETNGNRLQLTRGSPQVQRLFAVSGMLDHLPFVAAD